jgi:class 3 adenylate cyclase/pimeloyl-ACP methyl ester carboxylesterase
MQTNGVERRLAAIMFTDIVGYTATMAESEASGLRLRERHRSLLGSLAAANHGQIVDENGDELVLVFPSALDAVSCALATQAELREDRDLKLRIGIHLGDVVFEGGRIYGDGVNLASRIRPLAPAGGICVSEQVYDSVRNRGGIAARPLGERSLKNVERPVGLYQISASDTPAPGRDRIGARRSRVGALVGGAAVLLAAFVLTRPGVQAILVVRALPLLRADVEQEIGFTRTSDDVRIAYAVAGEGQTVLQVLGWFTHLEKGLNSPAFSSAPGWEKRFRFVRFDGRGSGLSDRGVSDYSLDARVRDIESVVDALGLERFSIFAHSAGCPAAIAYAVRNAERVEKIAIYGGFTRVADTAELRERWSAAVPLMRAGWGSNNVAFRQFFTSHFMPEGDEFSFRLFNEWQRIAAEPEDAARFMEQLIEIDVRELAPRVRAPTLVIHRLGDAAVPYRLGRELATLIPGARLLTLEGNNHAFLHGEPEMRQMLDAIEDFFRG